MSNGLNFAASLESGVATCEETCKLAERKLEELKRKIAGYQRLAERIECRLFSCSRSKKRTLQSLDSASEKTRRLCRQHALCRRQRKRRSKQVALPEFTAKLVQFVCLQARLDPFCYYV